MILVLTTISLATVYAIAEYKSGISGKLYNGVTNLVSSYKSWKLKRECIRYLPETSLAILHECHKHKKHSFKYGDTESINLLKCHGILGNNFDFLKEKLKGNKDFTRTYYLTPSFRKMVIRYWWFPKPKKSVVLDFDV